MKTAYLRSLLINEKKRDVVRLCGVTGKFTLKKWERLKHPWNASEKQPTERNTWDREKTTEGKGSQEAGQGWDLAFSGLRNISFHLEGKGMCGYKQILREKLEFSPDGFYFFWEAVSMVIRVKRDFVEGEMSDTVIVQNRGTCWLEKCGEIFQGEERVYL